MFSIKTFVKTGMKVARTLAERHGAKVGFVVGTGLIIHGTVRVVKKAPEGAEILKNHEEKLKEINKSLSEGKLTEKEAKKEKGSLYLNTTGKLVVTYAPAVGEVIGGVGVNGTIIWKQGQKIIFWKGQANLAQESFLAYRARVRKKRGAAEDLEYLSGKEEGSVQVTVKEPGKEPKVEEASVETFTNNPSPYLRIWRPYQYDTALGKSVGSTYCDPVDFEGNRTKLLLALQSARSALAIDGRVWMNDILDNLNMEQDRIGHHAGWTKNGCKERGEDIDFLLEGAVIEEAREHWQKYNEMRFLLDFNVEGCIDDKVEWGISRAKRSW